MRHRTAARNGGIFRRDPQIAQASAYPYANGASSGYSSGQWESGSSAQTTYGQQAAAGSLGQSTAGSAAMAADPATAGEGTTAAEGSWAAGAGTGTGVATASAAPVAGAASTWQGSTAAGAAAGAAADAAQPGASAAAGGSTGASTAGTAALGTDSTTGSVAQPHTGTWTAQVPSSSQALWTPTTTLQTSIIPSPSSFTLETKPSTTTDSSSSATTTGVVTVLGHEGTSPGTKAAIGVGVSVAVIACVGFLLWTLHKKKRALQNAIANHYRTEKPGQWRPPPPKPSPLKKAANAAYAGGAAAARASAHAGARTANYFQSRIPRLREKLTPNSAYTPIKDFTLLVYATGRTALRSTGGFVKSTWKRSKVHIPRPQSAHIPSDTLRDGFRQLHHSYLDLPRTNPTRFSPLPEVQYSTETLVGDIGRLKEVSSTPPQVESSKIPEAKVATLETVSPALSTKSSSPGVSRSPTIEIPTIEIPTSRGAPPISMARVYRVDMDFRAVSPEHIELKEGQTAILHLIYEDGWALVTVMETNQEGLVPRACFSAQPIRNQAQYLGNNIHISTEGIPRSLSSGTPTEAGSDGDLGRFYSTCVSPEPTLIAPERPSPQRLKSLPSLASLFRSAHSFKSMV
ncbi:hypothetical protein BO70DRAFT_426085 [Aspergillus heteromorphus CBS 117.55]|uniref:SH3 domain-containing protein n=1 Tax=Aspergillus heteromorphus CBS 117.55 TaxID=1448321 RepID=A0A317WYW3_9EURO|nr:uncharacterized protein BO70DRAFT_426085 [Aspergillus heteromorphus CBS 117.55]PWY91195.1 hypothetical protein BO70DRAFT_426085 [Aspergillus heteromorphus CBS 117.55]